MTRVVDTRKKGWRSSTPFAHPVEYFEEVLVGGMVPDEREDFQAFKSVVVETGYVGRAFVVFDKVGRNPVPLDRCVITSISADGNGATCTIYSHRHQAEQVVQYAPQRLFDHDVFIWLPLHMRIHYDVILDRDEPDVLTHSVGFNVCLKVRDRFDPDIEGCMTFAAFREKYPGVNVPF